MYPGIGSPVSQSRLENSRSSYDVAKTKRVSIDGVHTAAAARSGMRAPNHCNLDLVDDSSSTDLLNGI